MADKGSNTLFYLNGVRPEPVRMEICGAVPTMEEAQRLTGIKFKRRHAGPQDKAEIKGSLKWIFISAAFAVLGVIGIILSWVTFDEEAGAVGELFANKLRLGIVLMFFFAVIAFWVGWSSLRDLLQSRRMKSAFDAMRWMWISAIFCNENLEEKTRFSRLSQAIFKLKRIIPTDLPFPEDRVAAYMQNVRACVEQAADLTTKPMFEADKRNWLFAKPNTQLVWTGEQAIAPGIKQIQATLYIKDCLKKMVDRRATLFVTAEMEIYINQTFIYADGHWFPYDITPPIRQFAGHNAP